MSGRPNNAGIYNYDNLNAQNLFIKGKRFEDYITELVFEDQFEAGEIAELQLLLQYLNTTGLSSEWIVDNNNKNQDLKTAITNLQTKLANIDTTTLTQSSVLNDANRNSVLKTAIDNLITKLANIDTTALTQSSVLTNDNRNSVLKSRLDGNDGSLTDLSNKTRYIQQSTVGNNSADPKTANTLSINVNSNPSGIHKGDLSIQAGFNLIRMKNNSTTLQDINYNDNQMTIMSPNGMISSDAHLNRMMATDKIEIGNLNVQSSAAINIGGKGAQINIGSIDDPAVGQTNTIITIGKRTNLKNTETYHKGNQYIAEARFEDLPVSTGITLSNIYALLSGSAPSYVLGAFVATAGGFNYSDVLHMNLSNPLQKNKDITTSKGITLDSLKIFDANAISLGFPKISTYFVNGDIVSTQVVGDNTTSVFSGKIKLENHNTLNPLNINWAFSQDDDRVNTVDIKGDDGIFIHQGASAVNQPLRIINSCGSGGIELKVGGSSTEPANRGKKEHAVGGLFLRQSNQLNCAITKLPPDESIFGFKRKTNNNNAKVDYRLLVSCNDDEPSNIPLNNGAQNNHGIVVYNEAKHKAIDDAAIANATQPVYTEYTAIDEDNVTTPSLSFLGNYAGSTTKTLYTNANSDLMWDGQPVAVGSIAASGGGLTYVITAPSNTSITHANQVPTSLTMSSTYTSTPLRTATLSAYNANTNYQIVSIVGAIPKAANPILSGTYELNQFVDYASNTAGSLYAKLYFTALPLNNVLLNKTYTSPAGSGNVFNISTAEIKVPMNNVTINISSVLFPSVFVGGTAMGTTTLTLTAIDQTNTILHTFPAVNVLNQTTSGRLFIQTVTITDTTNITSIRFSLTATNQISQASAFNASNANYVIEGGFIHMLLYDGTTNPSALTPNAISLYPLSLPLPTTPFVITDYENPNITLEEWFIQPTGSTTNHSVALRFNDGGLSHVHTSIASISAVPTLSSVMAAGNSVGSNVLNMNSQNINNVATITANTVTPQAITGWNVKSLNAGNGITTVNNGSGEWTITNTGVLTTPTISQVLTAGSAAGNQNLSGINTLTATTITPTNITGWNVKQITAGSGGIIVSNNGAGTYTISNDAQPSGGYLSAEYDYPITASTPVSQKLSWYGQNWSRVPGWTTNTASDVYMSANGKYMAVATRGINLNQVGIFYSTDYNVNYATSNVNKNWRSIAGTTTGDAIWAIQGGTNENNVPWARELWKSTNFGVSWTQQTSPPDFSNANPNRIRVSADGKYQLITDGRTNGLGKLYRSTDYGVTWTSKNLTTVTGTVGSVAISSNGAIQFAEISGTSEGLLTNTGSGGIYLSTDYGVNFNRVNTTDPIWNMSCDATGRIVAATTNTGVLTSRDYGQTWKDITIAGATAVSVCPGGNIIWIGCINQASTAQLYYSEDYGQTFVVANQNPLGSYISTNYLTIATNHDGSIIVGGGNDNLNRFRLQPPEVYGIYAGTGISISSPFGLGSYQISSTVVATNDYQLWANGSVYEPFNGVNANYILDWSSFGKIDLVLYDIKYEIDIHWDANTSTTTSWPFAFIEMGLNKVMSIDNLNQGIIAQTATNWTNISNSGTWGGALEYNQSYFGRFFAGFSQVNNPVGTGNPAFRYKTLLSGYLNYNYRTVSQTGITDNSVAGRLIQNHFTCDSFLQQNTGSNTWGIWFDGTTNDAHQIRIHGASLWDTSMNGRWDANNGTNEALSQGIYRIVLRTHEGVSPLTLRPRGGQLVYRIYRIKK